LKRAARDSTEVVTHGPNPNQDGLVKIELGSIVLGLVMAVVSARVTLHYALKRFYFEKWWERKAEAYNSIFEALHHLKNQADHELVSNKINDPSLRLAWIPTLVN
jgi:hypothetical protein